MSSTDHSFAASDSNYTAPCPWLSTTAKPLPLAAKHDQDHRQYSTDWRGLVQADAIACWWRNRMGAALRWGEYMIPEKLRQIVRQFGENGLKLLLENPLNVVDLLRLGAADIVPMIETEQLRTVQTTFVQSDYRHVESDIVLVAPLRRAKTKRMLRRLLIYILIEHQSRPDRLMPLRSLDYTLQVFRYQVREWSKTHRSFSRIRFDPVLPVIFYTGTLRWDSPGRLVDLVDLGEQFQSMIPSFEPLFINLPEIPAETLESQGGYFGWVLRLVQQRSAEPGQFEALLEQVVQHLETMPDAERLRWLELLSYIMALVYHVRDPSEQPKLRKTIESSVRTDPHRQEIHEMGRSMADVLEEKGALKALQQTLLRLLKRRFGNVPAAVSATIRATDDPEQLDDWLDQVVTVATLDDMGIGTPV